MTLAHPTFRLHLDPDPDPNAGGGSATPPDWRAALPKELADDPTIATIPDIPTLAKNVIEQRKFIGLKRVAAPEKNWDDTKWSEWHELGGKPKAADEYTPGKVELPEGMAMDEERLKAAKAEAHKLGLSQKQFEGLTKWFFDGEAAAFKTKSSEALLDRETSIKVLRDDWKGDFDKNMDIARAALQKFGDEDLFKFLDENKLGNHPKMVKAFHKIGLELIEDTARGKGPGLGLNDTTNAKLQLDQLMMDDNFNQALRKAEHPGHAVALAKWTDLHKRAYPNKAA